MNIQEMHYDFEKKLNKVSSEQYKNLLIPEIDWVLNEAQEIFVKNILKDPNFEAVPQNIEDIRTLITESKDLSVDSDNKVSLPIYYWRYLKGKVNILKNGVSKRVRIYIRDEGEEFTNNYFENSSYEWNVVNGTIYNNSLKLYTDGTFTFDTGTSPNNPVSITYVKNLTSNYIHYAEGFTSSGYKMPGSNINLTGSRDSILPPHTHRKIVDIAVLITTGELESPNYKLKEEKLKLD